MTHIDEEPRPIGPDGEEVTDEAKGHEELNATLAHSSPRREYIHARQPVWLTKLRFEFLRLRNLEKPWWQWLFRPSGQLEITGREPRWLLQLRLWAQYAGISWPLLKIAACAIIALVCLGLAAALILDGRQ